MSRQRDTLTIGVMGVVCLLLFVLIHAQMDVHHRHTTAVHSIEQLHSQLGAVANLPSNTTRAYAAAGSSTSADAHSPSDVHVAAADLATQKREPSDAGPADVATIAKAAIEQGDPARGAEHFASVRTSCMTCHKVGEQGGVAGPDLSNIGSLRQPEHLAESLLYPNRQIDEKYRVFQALTGDGQIVRGSKVSQSGGQLVLRDPLTQQVATLQEDDIEALTPAPSIMPEGLATIMSYQQRLDVIAFLAELGPHRRIDKQSVRTLLDRVAHQEASNTGGGTSLRTSSSSP